MKKTLCLAATAVLLTAVAFGQDAKSVPMSARDNVLDAGRAPLLKNPVVKDTTPKVPSYCKPCLFYGGDFDSTNANANGLASEKDLIVSQSEILNPFLVPTGHSWSVTGVFGNTLSTVGVIDPAQADWSIRTGVSSGNGGTIVASGTSAATYNATGRNGFGLNEYTVFVDLSGSPVSLSSGHYFLEVVPYCTNPNDSNCGSARYFESDTQGINRQGRQTKDDSFWNSSFFGANYAPTWGSTGGCAGLGCDWFSTGVRGAFQ